MIALLRHARMLAVGALLLLVVAACASDGQPAAEPDPTTGTGTEPATPTEETPTEEPEPTEELEATEDHEHDESGELGAAGLRVALNNLLQEHVFLAGAAVNEALQGNDPAFEAAAEALDANSVDISEAVGLAYGDDAGEAFLGLWRSHIDMFVDYTAGVATGDEAAQDQAVTDLTGYADDFAVFLAGANPDLPEDVVSGLVVEHVLTLKAAVDALAAGDAEAGFSELRTAMAHMHHLADPLADGIAMQFPERFPGEATSAAADLQRDLNLVLAEHTMLAGAAVNEALNGNDEGFMAAATALDGNSVDFADMIAGVYGDEAGEAFLGLWRSHIDMFVDYTAGVASGDEAAQEQAVTDLTGYATDFSVFLSDATGIDQGAAEQLVIEHVLTLKDAVDTIAAEAGNPFVELREATMHMQMIADPLAAQIADQQGL